MLKTAFVITFAFFASAAQAEYLTAKVDVSDQRMTVFVDGAAVHHWPVSTARPGKITPRGDYGVQSMRRMHYSSLYNNAPMPYTIFFRGNYAIHGTNHVKKLGRPASAGCVRLHTENAALLYAMVKEYGRGNVKITVVD